MSLRTLIGLIALAAGLLAAQTARAQSTCSITQITQSASGESRFPSLDGDSIAFESSADLTGDNSDRGREVFLFDGSKITQITQSGSGESISPSLEAGSIAFTSRVNLTGANPEGNSEVFLASGSAITQITQAISGDSFLPSASGGSAAFESTADLTGENPDHQQVVFLVQGSTTTQIGDSTDFPSRAPNLDAGSIALITAADLTGDNPDHNEEIFLFHGSTVTQITDHHSAGVEDIFRPSLDGGSVAFASSADLTADNADGSDEIFLFEGSALRQVTDTAFGSSSSGPSLDGDSIAFASNADLTGRNSDLSSEIFLFNGSTIAQITDSTSGDSGSPSLDEGSIAFSSTANLTGDNPDGSQEIFLATCGGQVPPLPPGPFLTSGAIPGFRFKVRITAGAQAISGKQEAECIGETLCVSGALPGRSELFLRIIGPRPNGFLWTNLVRFTPSRVEVWAEQISSGTVNYYDLSSLPREDTELTGLVDKQAFPPPGSAAGAVASAVRPVIRARELTPWEPERPHDLVPSVTGLPGPLTFTSPAFPDFRFTVRIFSGTEEQPVQMESDCIPETVCVSGALPGRSELFLRIIGPRPNGFLWTNLVRFTTSRVEVEIEQLATGETRVYILDEVPRQSDQLPGRVDKEAFLP